MCRVKVEYQTETNAPAACLIKFENKLLALQHDKNDVWWLPQQKRKTNLNAQCSAHQAIWKDTGLNVEVGMLLFTDEHNLHVYQCHLTDNFAQSLSTFNVPPWASRSVTKIALVDPFATQEKDWHSTMDLPQIREAFTK